MANEFESHNKSANAADGQPETYERDATRAEVMAYAEDGGRVASKRFAELALKAADNVEAGNNQPVSHKYEYEWDPPFSGYKTEWNGVEGKYDETDKVALAAIAMSHPNKETISGDNLIKENYKTKLSHEEIADAAIEHAQAEIQRASRAAEHAGERYDEKKQKASDIRSRIAKL